MKDLSLGCLGLIATGGFVLLVFLVLDHRTRTWWHVALLGLVVLGFCIAAYVSWRAEWMTPERKLQKLLAKEEAAKLKKETNKRLDQGAEAIRKYKETLAILQNSGLETDELAAAQAKAKQQYLRDIDEVMK